jgi:hypothetical protein
MYRGCLSLLVSTALLCGCSSLPRLDAAQVPFAQSKVGDYTTTRIRYSPFEDGDVLRASIEQAFMQETPESYSIGPNGEHIYNYLSISGGGSDGAFGAGLLNGWSETGDRPKFKVVTGVSTGALIAPLAFLGSDFDEALKKSYTTVDASHIFTMHGLLPMLWSESATSTKPLQDLIGTYVSEHVLDLIAAEYKKGRRLYVASTNIDAEQPIIWDMGAIAASGKPDRLELFRKVLLASASIPSLFPPVLIDVNANGKKYQEMHVDGGTIAQLFLYPPTLEAGRLLKRKRVAYIIRNARLDPDYVMAERRTINIAGRAINTMLAASGHNDVLRTYFISQRDGVDYNLAYIGTDFTLEKKGEFEQPYMQALFQYGYDQAKAGREWHKLPPAFAQQPVNY